MTFYFYDLETSGVDPRRQRIMQFAGQRTDQELNPIGEPFVTYVKLSDDILPEPEAVLLTGITPQITESDGLSEPEFLRQFTQQVVQPNTCIVGYNNIRFDDEFMRFTQWRNFYDPYTWQWQDGCSRWDLIDVVRMTRALKPEGIEWPNNEDGTPNNRLAELTSLNKLEHANAHDALSDVLATIEVAKLLRSKQPKLFDYLYSIADKKAVQKLLDPELHQPFVHTSGMIPNEYAKTSVYLPLFADKAQPNKIVCYDLRFDPSEFADLTVEQLRARLFTKQADLQPGESRTPLKGVGINKCPAVAPLGVLKADNEAQARMKLTLAEVEANRQKLGQHKGLMAKLFDAWQMAESKDYGQQDPEDSLYGGGFLDDNDRQLSQQVVATDQLIDLTPAFHDQRLTELFFRYKARNYPNQLSEEEHEKWEAFRRQKLITDGALQNFGQSLQKLSSGKLTSREESLLTDLQLYAESIVPEA